MTQDAAYELSLEIGRVLPSASIKRVHVDTENGYTLLVSVARGTRRYSTHINSPVEWGLLLAVSELVVERGKLVTA